MVISRAFLDWKTRLFHRTFFRISLWVFFRTILCMALTIPFLEDSSMTWIFGQFLWQIRNLLHLQVVGQRILLCQSQMSWVGPQSSLAKSDKLCQSKILLWKNFSRVAQWQITWKSSPLAWPNLKLMCCASKEITICSVSISKCLWYFRQFGGNLFQPSGPNDADIQRAFKTWKSSQCLSDMCSKTALWTPWIRMENSTTGQAFWMNQDTLEIASYLPWAESRPDGNDIEACVVAQMSENGPMTFNDYACTFKIPFFCKTIGLLNFNLRGMCQHSNVDSQYMVPIKDLKDRCRFTFDGLGGTTMTFNDQLKRFVNKY